MNFIRNYFGIDAAGTSIKTEVLAGFTTFLTMAYIAFVNPGILEAAGMPFGPVMVATCLSAAIATMLMGVYAKMPIGLAPGMGTNAYFAFSVCGVMMVPWQTALGAVFISGVLFLILSVTGLREKIILAIPDSMKHAVAAGIGMFIAFIGLKQAGIVVDNKEVLVGLGNILSPSALVCLIGIVVCTVMLKWKVTGALLWGILITSAFAMIIGVAKPPTEIVSMPPSLKPTFMAMDIKGAFSLGVIHLIFAFFFVDIFDTVATLVAVGSEAGMLKKNENGRLYLPKAGKAFTSDAVGTMAGAALGTSTVTAYIESASGIAVGGKTGLTAVVVAIGFILMLFFAPLVGSVPSQATAPILIIVCFYMMKGLGKIEWSDPTEAIPSVIACLAIPLTSSISNGLALGFILYPIIKIFSGRYRDVHWLMYILAAMFIAKFIWL